jgi:translation initiation factor IF-2
VVAINKIDKPGTDVDKVKRELSENEVLVEDWGGKVQAVEVSAKEGTGMDNLIDGILLESEMLNLQSNFDCPARGTVIESRIDKGLGPVATVLIQKGTLSIGDLFICNDSPGKVRALINERGQRIKEAYPSDAIQILGFDQVPQAADILRVIEDEKILKRLTTDRQRLRREIEQKKIAPHSLDVISSMIKEGETNMLPLVIKGDVDGSIDALSETLEKLNTKEVSIKVIHKAVGPVSESDILLAQASNAVIIGFHVLESSNAKLLAKQTGVEVRIYNVIYKVVEEIKLALEGLLEPDKIEEIVGRATVLEQFKIPKIGFIAGSQVTEGIIKRNGLARLIRDDEVISEGNQLSSLKRFKDDVKEVKEGMECGISLEDIKKYKKDDVIEIYEIKEVKRKLESTTPL